MLFTTDHAPARDLAAALASVVALALDDGRSLAHRYTVEEQWRIDGIPVASAAAMANVRDGAVDAGSGHPRRVPARPAGTAAGAAVDDTFQQGHVMVSVSSVLTGLALVVAVASR